MKTPLETLWHHVSGAIERGEKQAIAGIPAQHTPGPWVTLVPPSISPSWRYVSTEAGERVASVEFLRVPEEALANARLIAAAPELLEALREIVALNDYAIPRSVRQRENEPRWLFAARAAIAKATGQS